MAHRPYVLFIYGPTGVGKTDFALQLSKEYGWNTEIINIDVGQFYRPLSVGTAKPSIDEQALIPHHLFDCIDTPINFSVIEYRARFMTLIQEITARGKLPLVVGGSGFYLKSLFFPPDHITHTAANQDAYSQEDNDDSWALLNAVDPRRAGTIHPHDHYRIERALALWRTEKVLPSAHTAQGTVAWNNTIVFLWRDRPVLYERINQRVESMVRHGWLDEVRALQGTVWEEFIARKKLIGYHELFEMLKGCQSLAEYNATVATIQSKTRHYAKRQLTFWKFLTRSLQPLVQEHQLRNGVDSMKIESINIGTMDTQRYIQDVLRRCTSN